MEDCERAHELDEGTGDVGGYLADGEDVVDVEALEEGPHGEVDVDQAASEVEAAGEAGDDFEAGLGGGWMWGGGGSGGGGVEADELAWAGGGVGEDLGDLEGVELDVLGEARPGEREIVAHEVVYREPRHESYEDRCQSQPLLFSSTVHPKIEDGHSLSPYGSQNTASPGRNSVLSPRVCPTVLATS